MVREVVERGVEQARTLEQVRGAGQVVRMTDIEKIAKPLKIVFWLHVHHLLAERKSPVLLPLKNHTNNV
jgi:ligand-binding SRPBCC domain-containing protein